MKPIKRTTVDLDACYEVQIHYKRPLYDMAKKVTTSESAEILFRDFADADRLDHKEFFWVMFLTNANQVIAMSELSVGCAHGTLVNIKEIGQLACLTNATAIIVAHYVE